MNNHYGNWTKHIPSHSTMSWLDTGEPVHDKTPIRLIHVHKTISSYKFRKCNEKTPLRTSYDKFTL